MMKDLRRFATRQEAAIMIWFAFFLAIPAIVGLILLFVSCWVLLLGGQPHQAVWGWLSDRSVNAKGQVTWGMGNVPILYFFGCVNAYVLYQFSEVLHWLGRSFYRALTPGRSRSRAY